MSRIPLTEKDRDLNKQVAYALGWKDLRALKIQSRNSLLLEGVSPREGGSGVGFRTRHHVPNYAGDMNSALELLEELRARGYHESSLSRQQRTLPGGEITQRWECFLEDPLGRRVAEFADSAAHAVCLALLNAVSASETAPAPKRSRAKERAKLSAPESRVS